MCACTASQCNKISQPPPSAMCERDATTGNGAYFRAMNALCPALIVSDIAHQLAVLAANIKNPKLAPSEKRSASVPITRPLKSFCTMLIDLCSILNTSGSNVFILVLSSKHAMPSPRSHRLADPFLATGLLRIFTSFNISHTIW